MRFNLSDWALNHRSLVWYLLIVSLLAGALSYMRLGREEDPSFTIRTMVIQAALPGATTEETALQVTDRIEKKLQELDSVRHSRSVTQPGSAIVYVDLYDETPADQVRETWLRIRQMMADITPQMPDGFRGFGFNDDFGDVYGSIWALTSDGFSPRELRDEAEEIRTRILAIPQAGKVNLIGERDQAIYIEFSSRKLAALGVDKAAALASLAAQNTIVPSGVIDTGAERIIVRVESRFRTAAEIAAVNLKAGDYYYRLSDVADVHDGYETPPGTLFRFNGQEAVGIAVGMKAGENVQEFGAALDLVVDEARATLPLGIEMHRVADQPHVVTEAVGHFIRALAEAVLIVLAVSFVSLGFRAGLVVSLSIPLVLALTFVVLEIWGITLQRVSLGALIIALGLLVDDAMIAIETMISRLEAGDRLEKAASFAWTSIAFPMLTGTLVTVAGFIPIGLNSSKAGEFTFSLFVVIAVSLVLSWIVAVFFAPLLGAAMLPKTMKHHQEGGGRLRRGYDRALNWVMRHPLVTVLATVVATGIAVWGMTHVEQQFFPSSDRTELIVDVALPPNASIDATDKAIGQIETFLAGRDEVAFWTAHVGESAPRFILAYDVQTPGKFMGQIVIQTETLAARDSLRTALEDFTRTGMPGVDAYVKLLEIGPPVGKPVQYRISGRDADQLRSAAQGLASLLAQDARLKDISIDWGLPARMVQVDIDHARLRRLGLTPEDIAQGLYTLFDGAEVTAIRDGTYLIPVVARGSTSDRTSLDSVADLQIATPSGDAIPLASFSSLSWTSEQPLMMTRDRLPTVTIKAAIDGHTQPATIVADLAARVAEYDATLPAGYHVALGGAQESSAESQAPIVAIVPIMLLILVTLTMLQMQGFRMTFIAIMAAPPGLIGVVAALLLSGRPMGFVAILGVLALMGILIRNSIILLHEVRVQIDEGRDRWAALALAANMRARPILLTAAAASLALIPIARQVFWGPMAFAMMGGIIVGTLVTLLFIPALYCLVMGVRPPARPAPAPPAPSQPAPSQPAPEEAPAA